MGTMAQAGRLALGAMLAFAATGGAAPANAGADPVARLAAAVAPYLGAEQRGLGRAALAAACGGDVVCAARRIAVAIGPPARLAPIAAPDSDTIRWVTTRPSVGRAKRLAHGRALIAITGFGRTVERELLAALEDGTETGLVIDLRENGGGDFGRMLRVAARLVGPHAGTLTLNRGGAPVAIDLPRLAPVARPGALRVLVGPRTASSAEILAALLRRHGGAQILGARTVGKDWLTRIVPVNRDWRLYIPGERVRVPGETLAGGLVPDGPLPPLLARSDAP